MKQTILLIVTACIGVFLMTAFIKADFNPANWSEPSRFVCACIFVWGCVIIIAYKEANK